MVFHIPQVGASSYSFDPPLAWGAFRVPGLQAFEAGFSLLAYCGCGPHQQRSDCCVIIIMPLSNRCHASVQSVIRRVRQRAAAGDHDFAQLELDLFRWVTWST